MATTSPRLMRRGGPSGRLLIGGLRARSRLHAGVLVAAALTIAAAVVGPVYARAAEESILQDGLRAAPGQDSGLHLAAAISPDDPTISSDEFRLVEQDAPRPSARLGYGSPVPVLSWTHPVTVSAVSGAQPSRLVWRRGFCAHLVVVAGRCPVRAGEAIVSQRTLTDGGPGWRLGAVVTVTSGTVVRVVGSYRARSADDPYWFGVDYFDGGLRGPAADPVLAVDSLFVARAELDAVPYGTGLHGAIDYPLDAGRVRLDDRAALLHEVDRLRGTLTYTHLTLHAGIAGLLAATEAQRRDVERATGLVAVQLVVLGFLVLFFVTLDGIEARRREIALARLRGQSRASVVRFALAEPMTVLLVSLPFGVVPGWAAAALLGAAVLLPGTPVALPLPALGTALLVLAGAAAAAALSARQVLTRPVLAQWRRAARPDPAGRSGLVARLVLAGLAVAAVVALLTTGVAPVAVLGPLLILVAVAAVGVPLIPAIARRAAPASRASGRIAGFLAVRRVGRGRQAVRTAALLTVTAGLAAFAVGGESVLVANRLARAEGEVGAPRVVDVQVGGTADPEEAVRRVDPAGRWATAVARWLPDGGGSVTGTVLAIDPSRFAAIALSVRGAADPAALAAAVRSGSVPDVRFAGTRVTARLTATDLVGDPPATAAIVVRTSLGRTEQVEAGPLRAGTATYSAEVDCASGCSFLGLSWTRPVLADGTLTGRVTVRALTVRRDGAEQPLAARLTDPRAWRAAVPVSESSDRVSVDADGPADAFRTETGYAGLAYASVPASLPAVASPQGLVPVRPDAGWGAADSFGTIVRFHVVARTPLLPAVLDRGVEIDLQDLERSSPAFVDDASWEVWLGPAAPADAVQRLTRAGLIVGSTRSVAERQAELGREGPALAFVLLVALALAAAALAVTATAVAAGAAARAGAYEAAAMRMIGVRRRTLARAAGIEQAALLGAAALLGIPAGAVAVALVLPLVPEASTTSPVPLRFAPPVLPLAVFAGGFVLAVLGVALLAARQTLRSAGPQRLREVDA